MPGPLLDGPSLGLGPTEVLLAALMFAMGVWNTAGGPSGGITFAVLAATLSPSVALPVQSVVEGVSGGYRSWTLRRFHDASFLVPFVIGGVAGFGAGLAVLASLQLSERALLAAVAGFIIVTTWLPVARAMAAGAGAPMMVGAVTSFLSLFIGGLGAPIATALASRGVGHAGVIATSTTAVNFHYVVRLAVFGLTGFSLVDHLPLIAVLTVASVAGTWLGGRLLVSIDQRRAAALFRLGVTAIAVAMLGRVAGLL